MQFSLFTQPEPCIDGIDKVALNASYSADVIAMQGKVRKPVSHNGDLWVNTGGHSLYGVGEMDAYRLVTPSDFTRTVTTYRDKTGTCAAAEAARKDPFGFYDGMQVQSGGKAYILCGPEQTLQVAAEDSAAMRAERDAHYASQRDDEDVADDLDDEDGVLFGDDDLDDEDVDQLEAA